MVNNKAIMPLELDPRLPDHIILATAIVIQNNNEDTLVQMITNDINMRCIGDVLGLKCEDYISKKAPIQAADSLYSGVIELEVPDDIIQDIYNEIDIFAYSFACAPPLYANK